MKLQESNHPLHLHQHLISTVLTEIPHIESFKGKWSLIKTKLQTLSTHLSDLADFPHFSSNSLSSDLLRSFSQTLSDAVTLVAACRNPTPPSGKLRTQSDLDSVSARLDQHLCDADLLIKSDLLHGNPVEAASTNSISKREAIRIETRNLITRLQIGALDSKRVAMDSLLQLLFDDDKNVLIAVAQGIVPVLVRLLDSSCLEFKEKSVSAISRISVIDSTKHVLAAEGILLLNHLLRILESGSGFGKEKACIALQSLSFTKDNARSIGSRGGISSLLEICHEGTPGSQAVAAGVLRNLAGIPEIRPNLVEENAVSVLIGLSASGTPSAQENAIGFLCNFVSESEDESLKVMVTREGGVNCLKSFWDGVSSDRSLEVAIGLLRNLSSCKHIADLLVLAGFIPLVAGALNHGASSVRIAAARSVYDLASNMKTKKEIGESGCISYLARMLDAKAVEEREVAAKSLSSLMLFTGNRRVFQKEERGIESAVQLLDPSISNLEKKFPVKILLLVSQSKKCRKRMIAAGACGYLQKLEGMEIEGAKKLLESLGRGKLWGVFSRT